jgi:hypothetical protein
MLTSLCASLDSDNGTFHTLHEDEIEVLISCVIQLEARLGSGISVALQSVDDALVKIKAQHRQLELQIKEICLRLDCSAKQFGKDILEIQAQIHAQVRQQEHWTKDITKRLSALEQDRGRGNTPTIGAPPPLLAPTLCAVVAGCISPDRMALGLDPPTREARRADSRERMIQLKALAKTANQNWLRSSSSRLRAVSLDSLMDTNRRMMREAQNLATLREDN